VGWFAYVGATTAGYPFGKIAEDYGWGSFFIILLLCALFAFSLLSLVWVPHKRESFPTE
jgi:OPA family sugar phosphate sensor protein UhpC-like MFS transporter